MADVQSVLQCNPPERSAVQQKERSPMELFVRHLFHDVLIKKTVDKVLKLVRKLHWEDLEVLIRQRSLDKDVC